MRELIDSTKYMDATIVIAETVPDNVEIIKATLIKWCDQLNLNLIFTLGGTGFSPRDVTPEATKAIIEKEAHGLSIAMIKMSLDITPFAMLSRPVCGIRKHSLILNFPGSPKAVKQCFEMVIPSLKHAVDLINGDEQAGKVHKKMQADVKVSKHEHSCPHKRTDPCAVAFRPRHSTFPMITVDEAQSIVLNSCIAEKVETINFLDGVGRVLVKDVKAHDCLPPFPASMKDGYAVIAADGLGRRKVVGVSIAGSQLEDGKLQQGHCMRISTGAPLPPGADAVVMVEYTKLLSSSEDGSEELEIKVMTQVCPGQDVREIGSDVKEGEVVLEKDTLLSPSDVGILATVGQTEIQVYALPTVAVLSTGNELQESQHELQIGRIRDSNRPALLSLLKQHGFPIFDAGIAEDTVDSLYSHIVNAFEKADVLVSSGGVSMGEKDLLRHVLVEKFNANVHFAQVDMKPGKPTTFATCHYNGKPKLVFGLPGNPVSAVVTCHLYVLPSCRKLSGYQKPLPTKIKAKWSNSRGDFFLDSRPEYHRVSLQWNPENATPLATSTGSQLSCRLLSMNRANGLAILPSKTKEISVFTNGTIVDVIVIGSL